MTDKQIIEEDMVNAENFCPHYPCQVDCYEARICPFFVETLQQLKDKEQECEMLKRYLNEIRDEELSQLDIEWDEYETSARKEDYSNIITLVERALGEIDV